MEKQTKLCKACNKIKPVEDFWRNAGTRDGWEYRCKICRKLNRKIPVSVKERPTKHKSGSHDFYSFNGLCKNDYMEMYRILSILGYDITQRDKTIQEQFVDKCNKENNLNLSYHERDKRHISKYLFDGSINPDYLHRKDNN